MSPTKGKESKYGWALWTVPELSFEKKELIPALLRLLTK